MQKEIIEEHKWKDQASFFVKDGKLLQIKKLEGHFIGTSTVVMFGKQPLMDPLEICTTGTPSHRRFLGRTQLFLRCSPLLEVLWDPGCEQWHQDYQ